MTIPPRFLDELRNRLTLSDMIGRRIKVTRAGREFKACCPFHKEKTPSFTINDDKQFYHCFGCGAHGDVIGFYMQHDNLSFIDAVEMLSAEAGLQMPQSTPEEIEKARKAKDLYAMMDLATSWMQDNLHSAGHKDIYDYLVQRGVKPQTLSEFRIGYAPPDYQALRTYLAAQGFSDADMQEGGLTKVSERGGDPYVFFRERIMFPVCDRRGRVVAFGGRALPDHLTPPDRGNYTPAKYMNSGETPLFDKSRVIFGESKARQAAGEGHTILVTEGYMDVIACHQAGFRGAVAPMGTALTEEQISLIWSMIPADEKIPVLCFDGDEAGRRAAVRACERVLPLLKADQSVQFAFLPDGEDPDSILRHNGAAAFKKILQASLPLFDFIWQSKTAGRQFSTPEARAGLVKTLEEDIRRIADAEVQRHYFSLMRQRCRELFYTRNYTNRKDNARPDSRGTYPGAAPGALKPTPPAFQNKYIQGLLAGVLNYPSIGRDFEEECAALLITDPRLDALRQEIISILAQSDDLDEAAFQTHLTSAGFEKELEECLSKSVYFHAGFARPGQDMAEVKRQWLETYQSLQSRHMGREIKLGWKKALAEADRDQEERLRQLLNENRTAGGFET